MSEESTSASASPAKAERGPLQVYVDDIRELPEPGWILVRNVDSAISLFEYFRAMGEQIDLLSLDHDMGIDWQSGEDLTTVPIVEWMIENDFWPKVTVVHSANPCGARRLEQMIERYGPGGFRYNQHKESDE